ncbi:MAG: RNA-binding protein [Planctomycetes bacterium]|nr:RNA-binding protein [Planctomycetota bacterium]
MRHRIFIDNLSLETTELDLHDLFAGNGRSVASVSIVRDDESGQSRGFGFVEMSAGTDVAALVVALDGRELRGRALLVSKAHEPGHMPQRSGRPLGDFGGRW